jgi:hypothetical protein
MSPHPLTMVAPPFALFEGWALGPLHPRHAACSTPRRVVSHRPPSRSRTGGAFVGVRRAWWLAGSRRASGWVVPAALGFHPELSQSLRPGRSLLPPLQKGAAKLPQCNEEMIRAGCHPRFEVLAGAHSSLVWLEWNVANVAASAHSYDLNRRRQKKCESSRARGVSGSP